MGVKRASRGPVVSFQGRQTVLRRFAFSFSKYHQSCGMKLSMPSAPKAGPKCEGMGNDGPREGSPFQNRNVAF